MIVLVPQENTKSLSRKPLQIMIGVHENIFLIGKHKQLKPRKVVREASYKCQLWQNLLSTFKVSIFSHEIPLWHNKLFTKCFLFLLQYLEKRVRITLRLYQSNYKSCMNNVTESYNMELYDKCRFV